MITAAVFWISASLVAYAYAGYPLLAALLARAFGTTPQGQAPLPTLSVVIAAHDEDSRIAARVQDVLRQNYPQNLLQVVVVDDGSSDDTTRVAAGLAAVEPRIAVITLADNGGKAAALNAGVAACRGEIVAFTDVRQRYDAGTLCALVAAFADPGVGAVAGDLLIEPRAVASDGAGAAAGVGLYWRLERRLRSDEARLGWLHGVSGANYAVRRDLYTPIPAGTILDDMWVPMHVVRSGSRVWQARDAIARDVHSSGDDEEFRRKLRTLSGNWQLIARIPTLLAPWFNPVFFAWLSHKALRLLVPWALIAMLVASAVSDQPLLRVLLMLQVAGYAAAAVALWRPRLARKVPLLPAAAAFVLLNAAALLSLPASVVLSPARLWRKH